MISSRKFILGATLVVGSLFQLQAASKAETAHTAVLNLALKLKQAATKGRYSTMNDSQFRALTHDVMSLSGSTPVAGFEDPGMLARFTMAVQSRIGNFLGRTQDPVEIQEAKSFVAQTRSKLSRRIEEFTAASLKSNGVLNEFGLNVTADYKHVIDIATARQKFLDEVGVCYDTARAGSEVVIDNIITSGPVQKALEALSKGQALSAEQKETLQLVAKTLRKHLAAVDTCVEGHHTKLASTVESIASRAVSKETTNALETARASNKEFFAEFNKEVHEKSVRGIFGDRAKFKELMQKLHHVEDVDFSLANIWRIVKQYATHPFGKDYRIANAVAVGTAASATSFAGLSLLSYLPCMNMSRKTRAYVSTAAGLCTGVAHYILA